MTNRTAAAVVALLMPCGVAVAAPGGAVEFDRDVRPILSEKCFRCHGPDAASRQADLRLDTREGLFGGPDTGAVVPGKPDESEALRRIRGDESERMPPSEAGPALSAAEVETLTRWIAQGAEWSPHWAFVPPGRRVPPATESNDAARNPIDAFVAARRTAAGLASVGEAPRHVLIRRLYLDLIGLPPTPEQVAAFEQDDAPDAYERLVDRLLSDPRHGERWGRHWMDVWRYSDWYGYRQELRNGRKHLWRWRDWIVRSINDGKPYDRMIVQMLAADEVAGDDSDAVAATGFLARSYYKFNRDVWLDDTVEHTGKAFLGLTFNCARCHDHMFDPIAQRDYYRLRAFFEPLDVRTDPAGGTLDAERDGVPRVYDARPGKATFLYVRGNDKFPDKEHPLSPLLPEFFVPDAAAPQPATLPPAAYYPGLRSDVRDILRQQADVEVAAADGAVRKLLIETAVADADATFRRPPAEAPKPWPTGRQVAEATLRAARLRRAALDARIAADDARYSTPARPDAKPLAIAAAKAQRAAALATADAQEAAARAALDAASRKPDAERAKAVEAAQKSLDAARKTVETAQAAAAKTDGAYAPLTAVHPATSTGRRTVLANWIADPSNPLTARVAVNHVWMRHVGTPLVESVFDFGQHGTAPTHPELLDRLAADFVASGWDFKRLHRMIVTSATYRQSSGIGSREPEAGDSQSERRTPQSVDPDNRLLWRMNARRAEAEVVRDSLLAASGRLDGSMGGPELDAAVAETTRRRSLYYRHAPEKYAPLLELFDGANAAECYRRAETVVPQQALALMNGPLSHGEAASVADRLLADAPAPEAFVPAAFSRLLGRPPSDAERSACVAFLVERKGRSDDADAGRAAAAGLVRVLFNHHEFVTIP